MPDTAQRQVLARTAILFLAYLAVAMTLPAVSVHEARDLDLGNPASTAGMGRDAAGTLAGGQCRGARAGLAGGEARPYLGHICDPGRCAMDERSEPDNTAVRTALWRALHVLADAEPPVLEDRIGLLLADPGETWRERPDMGPFTRPFRASIVARARFVEDLVLREAGRGTDQYVVLGAGLDTFAQRRMELADRLQVFEVDRPGPQAWKRRRLRETGLGEAPNLRFAPVDFEAGDSWIARLVEAGFDPSRPAVVACTGVSMYLSREAVAALLREVAGLAPGSALALSFLVPAELADPEIRVGMERSAAGAAAAGTPFRSFFAPEEMVDLAFACGLREARHVGSGDLARRFFADRDDGLRPPERAEELLEARA